LLEPLAYLSLYRNQGQWRNPSDDLFPYQPLVELAPLHRYLVSDGAGELL
jgi:hypothetical protein